MSTYKQKFNKKYGFSKDASHSLSEISKLTGRSLSGLKKIREKGEAAYYNNPKSVRPQVKSATQWGVARVYSAVMGGGAAKVDKKELGKQSYSNKKPKPKKPKKPKPKPTKPKPKPKY
jgi:hypothetical protein